MSYDPLTLCTAEAGYFEVDPAIMFPATLARIQEVLAGDVPTELVTPGWAGRPAREPVADKFVRQAEAFSQNAWSLETPERAAVLDFAEGWFKRALALKVSKGLRLHISRNVDYRRV